MKPFDWKKFHETLKEKIKDDSENVVYVLDIYYILVVIINMTKIADMKFSVNHSTPTKDRENSDGEKIDSIEKNKSCICILHKNEENTNEQNRKKCVKKNKSWFHGIRLDECHPLCDQIRGINR